MNRQPGYLTDVDNLRIICVKEPMKQVSDGFRRFLVGKPPQVSYLAGNFLFPGEHHEHEWLFLGGFFGAPVSITITIRCGILIYGICLFLME